MLENGSTALITADTGYKAKIWGFRGDRVTIISISGNAVIVENARGDRFPCNIKELAPWSHELERSLKVIAKRRKSAKQ